MCPFVIRAHMYDRSSRSPKRGLCPSWRFGTAPQRLNEASLGSASVPGPIYQLPSSLTSQATQFGPEVRKIPVLTMLLYDHCVRHRTCLNVWSLSFMLSCQKTFTGRV